MSNKNKRKPIRGTVTAWINNGHLETVQLAGSAHRNDKDMIPRVRNEDRPFDPTPEIRGSFKPGREKISN